MTSITRATTPRRTAARVSSKSSGVSTEPPGRSATIESTAQARQSSSSAGTLPCGLLPSASFWAFDSSASTRFHGAVVLSSSSLRTPSPVAWSARTRVGRTSTDDAVAVVDQRGEALDHPLAATLLERRRQRARSPTAPGPSAPPRRPPAPSSGASAARAAPAAPAGPCPRPAPCRERSSTRKVIRRWSGTRVQSHSCGSTPNPVRALSARPSSSVIHAPAGRVAVGQRGLGVVRRGDEVPAGGLGQRLQQGGGEVLAQPGHLPVEPDVDDLVEHVDRDVHGHAVGLRAGLELVGHRQARARPAARPAGSPRR